MENQPKTAEQANQQAGVGIGQVSGTPDQSLNKALEIIANRQAAYEALTKERDALADINAQALVALEACKNHDDHTHDPNHDCPSFCMDRVALWGRQRSLMIAAIKAIKEDK